MKTRARGWAVDRSIINARHGPNIVIMQDYKTDIYIKDIKENQCILNMTQRRHL